MRVTEFRRLAVSLATAVLLIVAVAPTATAGTTPVNGKYRSYAYIAASRHGVAVYIKGLVKQDSPSGTINSPRRTIYLQRKVNGAWQTMLSRVTNWSGAFTVGFISVPDRQYRYVAIASGGAWSAYSAPAATTTPKPKPPTPTPTPTPTQFANCSAMNKIYPHGVGKPGAHDKTTGKPVTIFYVNAALYAANTNSDRDRDGIACEKA
jgi:hypothetical protein